MSLYLRNATWIDPETFKATTTTIKVEEGPSGGMALDAHAPVECPPEDTVLDCTGRLVTPSFGCGHHHIYSALARGMPPAPKAPANFLEVLEYVWWRMDKKLDHDMIEASALVTGLYCAKNGVTFVIDHHASPFHLDGSLETIAKALDRVGLGHLLCYEISCRDGEEIKEKGLDETDAFLSSGRKGHVGLHASFTVDDDLLGRAVDLARTHKTGVPIHVAEGIEDQEHCARTYGKSVVRRLSDAGVLDLPLSILGHCVHLDAEERDIIRTSPCWVVQNTESNGRFHTDWLNMIYPRLKLAKDLLRDDGVIFISIDDNEVENLKKVCDEIFGSDNFLANIIIENDSRVRSYDSIAITHEYTLFYRKSMAFTANVLEDPEKKFQYKDEQGGYDLYELRNRNSDFNADNRPNLYYPFWVNPNRKYDNDLYEIALEARDGWIKFYPQESQGIKTVWRWGKERARQNLNTVIFGRLASGGWQVVKKYRESTYALKSIWQGADFLSDRGTLAFKKLFDNKRIFTFPKPLEIVKRCMELSCTSQDYILDFFSGSATTAHAVMQLNAEDGGHRKFIMVQLPEKCDEKSEAYKAGYKNICKIGKERIRRAGKQILSAGGGTVIILRDAA